MKQLLIAILLLTATNLLGQTKVQKSESTSRSRSFNKDSLCAEYDYRKADSVICHSIVDTTDNREVFILADKMPQFRGGAADILKYIVQNLVFPPTELCAQGTVYVGFIIEVDGTISHPVVLRSLQRLFDDEAVKVITNMPPWAPGECNGQKVPMYYVLPIRFTLY
jgi:TonB family protein